MPQISVERLDGMLVELMAHGVLISGLRPPSTSGDGLTHVLACLDTIDAEAIEEIGSLVGELRRINIQLGEIDSGWAVGRLRQRMRAVASVVEQPITVDCRLGGTMVLPGQVGDAAAEAADGLIRATPHRSGDRYMRNYHALFVDRYGAGALVRLDVLIDPTTGLGFPPHYDRDQRAGSDPPVSRRDERLLALAQQAALDGAREVEVNDEFLALLAADAGGPVRPAPHLEICAEVHAPTVDALIGGAFTLVVRGTSRSVFAMSGRFLELLDAQDRRRMIGQYGQLPTTVEGAWPVQLSFPPRYQRMENVARAPRLLPATLGLAEYQEQVRECVRVHDLAITADDDRLYVVSLSRRRVVEPVVANATARRAWPPLARLLVEIARSGTATVSPFDWGTASCLPFLPRVRYRRSVLSPAQWRIPSGALPPPGMPQDAWVDVMGALRGRLRLPDWVSVGAGDRLLRLNLDEPMDLAVLRAHLDQPVGTGKSVTVAEAPTPVDYGWAGGRAHEIVVPLTATTRPAPGAEIRAAAPTLIGPEHGDLPGERVVFARLYGEPDHVDAIVATHLPRLLTELGQQGSESMWWFIRYRDPRPHLRLRLHQRPEGYGQTVVTLGAWAADLRRRGLVGSLTLDTYRPEISRYGSGSAMDAAEAVFAADSVAARAQIIALTAVRHVHPRALTAASMVDLAAAMEGGWSAGMRWLLDNRPNGTARRLARDDVRLAACLADPARHHAALRALAGGDAIADAWHARRRACAAYIACLARSRTEPSPSSVLGSLLHLHHIRAIGIDPDLEQLVDRIARAVALTWAARPATPDGRPR